MNIRESLTNQNMPLSKSQILNNLKKVAKLAPEKTTNQEKKASKSLFEAISSMEPRQEQKEETVLNTNHVPQEKTSPSVSDDISIKDFFKLRMSNKLNQNKELNELNNRTLTSYIRKATNEIPGLEGASKEAFQRANMQWDVPQNVEIALKSQAKAKRRKQGILRAGNILRGRSQ